MEETEKKGGEMPAENGGENVVVEGAVLERRKLLTQGYLGGMLDSASSIMIAKTRRGDRVIWVPRVVVIRHKRRMVDYLRSLYGGTIIERNNRFRYEVNNENARKLLVSQRGMFVDRMDQVDAFLEFFDAQSEDERDKALWRFMEVKKRYVKT